MRRQASLGAILFAAILAGLMAGAVLGLFHSLLTEPVIDRAIALEESADSATGSPESEPVVSRADQKRGLVVGAVLYGLFVGLIFGGVYSLAQAVLPGRRTLAGAGILALGAYWLVALLPFLKYPANPPGVGLPETIEYRQGLYLAFLLFSIIGGAVAASALHRELPRSWVALGYGAFVLALLIGMPANPDPIEMPPDLVQEFRVLSLAGLSTFWLVLGLAFGLLAERLEARRSARSVDIPRV